MKKDDFMRLPGRNPKRGRDENRGGDPRYFLIGIGAVVFIAILLAEFLHFW